VTLDSELPLFIHLLLAVHNCSVKTSTAIFLCPTFSYTCNVRSSVPIQRQFWSAVQNFITFNHHKAQAVFSKFLSKIQLKHLLHLCRKCIACTFMDHDRTLEHSKLNTLKAGQNHVRCRLSSSNSSKSSYQYLSSFKLPQHSSSENTALVTFHGPMQTIWYSTSCN
jgi:hypothetical protein